MDAQLIDFAKIAGFRIHSMGGSEFITADKNYPNLNSNIQLLTDLVQSAMVIKTMSKPFPLFGYILHDIDTTRLEKLAKEVLPLAAMKDTISVTRDELFWLLGMSNLAISNSLENNEDLLTAAKYAVRVIADYNGGGSNETEVQMLVIQNMLFNAIRKADPKYYGLVGDNKTK